MGKLVNRITGSSLFISSLPGLALRTHVEFSKPCLVNVISKDTHLVVSITRFTSFDVKFTRLGFENAC